MDDSVAPSTATPPTQLAPRSDVRSMVWFSCLAYALSWAWLVPIDLTGGLITAGRGWPTHFPALLGPLLAAVVVTARRDGRRGVEDLASRMVKARVPLWWWTFAVSPVLLLPAVLLIDAAVGRPLPTYDDFAIFTGLPNQLGVFGVAAAVLLINGFGEETGWRGYALPSLQRHYSPLAATLILSVLWAGWHAPLFVVVDTFRDFTGPILVGWFLGLFCGAVVLTWLYNRSGGSILLVAVWHAAYNQVSATDAAKGPLAATATTLVIGLAAVLICLEIRAARQGHASVLGPPAEGPRPL